MTNEEASIHPPNTYSDLHQAELETQQLHQAGRALRALSDISRTTSLAEAQHFECLRRDDMSALLDVLGHTIMERSQKVDRLISRAARHRPSTL